jgi:hypothetical protein
MPNNSLAHHSTAQVRDGLRRVLEWISEHPHIPITRVGSVGGACAELDLDLASGRFDLLAAAADVADALIDATITVEIAPMSGRWCVLTIAGHLDSYEVTAVGIAYDQAATALLTSLGVPPLPGAPWNTTADHLRGVVAGAAR